MAKPPMVATALACLVSCCLVFGSYDGTSWGPECHKPDGNYMCDCPTAASNQVYYLNTSLWLCPIHASIGSPPKKGGLKGFGLRLHNHVNLGGEDDRTTPFADVSKSNHKYVLDGSDTSQFDNHHPTNGDSTDGNWLQISDGPTGNVSPFLRVWAAKTATLQQNSITLSYRYIRADICSFKWSNGKSAILNGKTTGSTCASQKAIMSCSAGPQECNAFEFTTVAASC